MPAAKQCAYSECGEWFEPRRDTAEYHTDTCRVYAFRNRQRAEREGRPDYAELVRRYARMDKEYWELKSRVSELEGALAEANRRKAGYLPEAQPGSIRLEPGQPVRVARVG